MILTTLPENHNSFPTSTSSGSQLLVILLPEKTMLSIKNNYVTKILKIVGQWIQKYSFKDDSWPQVVLNWMDKYKKAQG